MTTRPHVCLLFSALCCATHASAQPADVKAVLAGNCYGCHAAERAMGGLRLDLKASAFRPGDSAQWAIVPGKSSDSELFRRLTSAEKNRRMPLGAKPLAPETIEAIRTWIDGGAPWPDTAGAAAEQTWKKREMVVLDRDRQHWAFRPLARVVPPVTNVHAANPIDRFVLSVLESKGLAYEPEASREKLIRRAQFDLTGLPPSPDEIQQFAADPSAQAYEKLIDRLLASPHYGERWGRHWLDVARYADSEGYERDADQVQMYRYRDWVIRALNSDMPYDKFVSWQVAGDEYEPDNPEAVIATGFLAAGPRVAIAVTDTEENKEQNLYDELDDFVSTTAQATLGLTVGCARCHDHKFDPIPTRDYYRMVSVFRNFERRETYLSRPHRELERFLQRKRLALREEKMDALKLPEETRILLREPLNKNNSGQRHFYKQYDPQLRFTDAEFRAWLTLQDRATLERLERETAGGGPELEKAVIVVDSGLPPRNAHILDRGSVRAKKDQVPFGFLSVLSRGKEPHVSGASRRRALAEWLTDPESGAGNLLARVVVNRMWQYHFGEGLVRTPNDFGLQGDAPSHPELLDWLASELIRSGWRLKPIHKLIIMSSAYRQGAGSNPQKLAADPENRLLSRRRPVKLQGEVLRDSILSVSGSLNAKMFGPAVRPPIPESATATRSASKWPKDLKEGPEVWRRTIYVFNKRSIRIPWLETFDAPDWISSCGRRVPTTVPTQALTLLNDPFVREQSRRFAERIRSEEPADAHAQVNRAYRLAVGRAPSQSEEGDSVQFLQQGGRLPDFCHVLLTLNEFLYVD